MVAAKRFLTILRGETVLCWDLWVYAGTEGSWLELQNKNVCSTHNIIYQGWPVVGASSPSFIERCKGALLGPGEKVFFLLF